MLVLALKLPGNLGLPPCLRRPSLSGYRRLKDLRQILESDFGAGNFGCSCGLLPKFRRKL